MAKMIPDSRTPRRFTIMTRSTNITERSTRWENRAGKAEAIWATPAAIDTATVRM
jgi:hypothetical protein